MTPNAETVPTPSRAWLWPTIIISMLLGHASMLVVVVLIATSDRGFSVEPDYYQKAVTWDARAAQERNNEKLGWQATLSLGDKVSVFGEREITCRLVNQHDQPLDGGEVSLEFFPHARGMQRQTVSLTSEGDGNYSGTCKFHRDGVWEFRLSVVRGPESYTYTEQRDVYPPGETRPWRP